MILRLVDEAVAAGARLAPVCELLGLSDPASAASGGLLGL